MTLTMPTCAEYERMGWHQREMLARRLRLIVTKDGSGWRVTNGVSSGWTNNLACTLKLLADVQRSSR